MVILDREPPGAFAGVGSGTALLVGEFENGPFVTPTEVTSTSDLLAQFGGFGYTYDAVPANNPSARVRRADGAIIDEFWNGHGFIGLANKLFRRLILCRVNTSVGSVEFRRLACLSGANNFTYDLEPGQTVVTDIGMGNVTATFSATAATLVSGAGMYPSTFAGGESLTFAIDGQQFTAFFTAADQTQTQVIARLNAAAGYAAFTNAGPMMDDTTLTGRIRGTAGSVQIVAVSGMIVTTATGFAAGMPTTGGGNVPNIDAVTVAQAHTVVSAATMATVAVDRDANGNIRICNVATPLTGTIQVDTTSTADAFGWPEEVTASAATGVDGVIPAGTRVRNVGGTEWVTMQDIAVAATGTGAAGPYSVPVRHALDDTAGAAALAATVTTLFAPVSPGGFAVNNPLPLTAALTEGQIDAAYLAAIDVTNNISTVVKEANLLWSARQSNAIRNRVRQNAIEASGSGLQGRAAVVSPPLRTTRANALSTVAQPGVGAYRNDRVFYAFPGAQTLISEIAARGTAGGLGFTADGIIDTHLDSWVVSLLSQLAPEENPGQDTAFMSGIVGVERNNPDVQAMTLTDYRNFRAGGIAALRLDGGVAFIQSGVTSVDPVVQPNLRNIARRRMADFIQDSLGLRLTSFSKKLMTLDRRAAIMGEIDAFMRTLLSPDNPSTQRISGYTIDGKSGNTPTTLAQGLFRVILKVRTLASLDSIVLDTTIGEAVSISEAA